MNLIRVAGSCQMGTVAHAIAGIVRAEEQVAVEATGAAQVNLAIKAIALARDYLQVDDIEIAFVPEMEGVLAGDGTESALRFTIVRSLETTRYLGDPRPVLKNKYISSRCHT